MGNCVCTCNPDVHCLATKDGSLYLVNTTNSPLQLAAGELFGFGSGTFDEKTAGEGLFCLELVLLLLFLIQSGVARAGQSAFIGWILDSDADLVVHPNVQDEKVPMPLAEVYSQLAQKDGIMNISTVDYNLSQKTTDAGEAMNFRYNVSSKTKLNVFTPKVVEFQDMMNIKPASFGSLWSNQFDKLPKTQRAKILWEVQSSCLS